MSQSTKRSMPSSLIKKSDGPNRPPVVGQSISEPVSLPNITGKVISGETETSYLSLQEISHDNGRKLVDEQLELKQLHISIVDALPDDSPFKVIGDVLSVTTETLSSSGLSVFAPVLSDFREHAVDSLELSATLPEVPVRSLIEYVLDLDNKAQQFLLQGAQTLLLNEQRSAQSSLIASQTLTRDLMLGYPKLAAQLAHSSESVGSLVPRAWGSLGKTLLIKGLPQLGNALTDLSRRKFTDYSGNSAQIYSAHEHLRQSVDLKTKIRANLGQFALQVHTIDQTIRACQNYSTVNIDMLEKQILRQSKDIIHKEVSKQVLKLETYLKSRLKRLTKKHDVSKELLTKYLQTSTPSAKPSSPASSGTTDNSVSAQGTGSGTQTS